MIVTAYHRGMTPTYERVLGGLDSGRWTALRKEALIAMVAMGRLGRVEAQERYGISTAEFLTWERRYARYGAPGLSQRRLQQFGRRVMAQREYP